MFLSFLIYVMLIEWTTVRLPRQQMAWIIMVEKNGNVYKLGNMQCNPSPGKSSQLLGIKSITKISDLKFSSLYRSQHVSHLLKKSKGKKRLKSLPYHATNFDRNEKSTSLAFITFLFSTKLIYCKLN